MKSNCRTIDNITTILFIVCIVAVVLSQVFAWLAVRTHVLDNMMGVGQ